MAELVGGGLGTGDRVGVLGLLFGLLSVVGMGARLLKPLEGIDLTQAAEKLAEAEQADELAQRTQLLGGDNQPLDVGFVLCPAPSRVAAGAAPVGSLGEITDYYLRLHPRRLLITGAAGAGKTVLALELLLGLLEKREADDPVPVRLSLTSWDTTRPLEDWLTDEIAETYQLSRTTTRRLLEQRRVLPILDGLDEMDPPSAEAASSRAAEALTALNRYQDGRQKAALVVTCRTATYEALATQTRLLDAARIEVAPVTPDQAQTFINARALDPARWQPVLDHATRSPQAAVTHMLSTPWLLTLALIVYEPDGDPTELLGFTEPEALRDHLLHRFVPAATALHSTLVNNPYRLEQVEHWLKVLARYLDGNIRTPRNLDGQLLSGTDMVLHRLWPLAGTRTRVVDTVVSSIGAIGSVQ
ncbi:NACHT domain-containing protein [Actinacidiphila glaucinigra]|uniref:NACHT domain-containing protein n=1 Tax=Actinacidiphila glaucinigra TaxID=235986 RepID=UPI0033B781CF